MLIPSADNNLYAVDILTAKNLWVFASGAPIDQAPVVTGEDIYSINQSGYLTLLDPDYRQHPLEHPDARRTLRLRG